MSKRYGKCPDCGKPLKYIGYGSAQNFEQFACNRCKLTVNVYREKDAKTC